MLTANLNTDHLQEQLQACKKRDSYRCIFQLLLQFKSQLYVQAINATMISTPIAVDIAIYSRSMRHHTVGTSHIYPNIQQCHLHNSNFQVNAYTKCVSRCVSLYGDKSTYQLMNKEIFLVLFLSTYSITSIEFYELNEARYRQLQPPRY